MPMSGNSFAEGVRVFGPAHVRSDLFDLLFLLDIFIHMRKVTVYYFGIFLALIQLQSMQAVISSETLRDAVVAMDYSKFPPYHAPRIEDYIIGAFNIVVKFDRSNPLRDNVYKTILSSMNSIQHLGNSCNTIEGHPNRNKYGDYALGISNAIKYLTSYFKIFTEKYLTGIRRKRWGGVENGDDIFIFLWEKLCEDVLKRLKLISRENIVLLKQVIEQIGELARKIEEKMQKSTLLFDNAERYRIFANEKLRQILKLNPEI